MCFFLSSLLIHLYHNYSSSVLRFSWLTYVWPVDGSIFQMMSALHRGSEALMSISIHKVIYELQILTRL